MTLPSTFPKTIPNVGFCGHGWMRDENQRVLPRFLGPKTKTIVEVGTWLGLSARFMLDRAPNAKLYAVDHWNGLPEPNLADWKTIAPDPWLQFTRDCWDYRDRIVPIRADSWAGIDALRDLVPDLVYVDGGHAYERVHGDLTRIVARWPTTVIVGDDWDWDGVRQAAQEIFGERLNVDGNCWWVDPPG